MYELPTAIPDVDVLLALEPEELAAKILFLLRQRRDDMYHIGNLTNELHQARENRPSYPRERLGEIGLAFREACAWLEAQGLLVPAADSNGQNGWRVLSRRARRFENEAEFANYTAARLLPRELLHPIIAQSA